MKQANLRIKAHFSIIPHSLQQVELRSGVWNPTSFILHDEANTNKLYPILKDLNGDFTTQEMAKKHHVSRAEIESILDHLQQLNVIENATSEVLNNDMEYLAVQSSDLNDRIKNILIIGEDVICQEIKRILMGVTHQNSIATLDITDPAIKNIKTNSQWMFDTFMLEEAVEQFAWWKDYFIVLALTRNDPLLAMRLNQMNYTLDVPWIHGVIDGPFIFVGPAFFSQAGPCYHCFEKRVTMNLREYASYQRYKETLAVNDCMENKINKGSPVMHVLAAHLAMEVLNYHHLKTCFTKSKALSIYLPTMEICFNEVLRLSGCTVCGAVSQRDDQQLYYDYQTVLENVIHD